MKQYKHFPISILRVLQNHLIFPSAVHEENLTGKQSGKHRFCHSFNIAMLPTPTQHHKCDVFYIFFPYSLEMYSKYFR